MRRWCFLKALAPGAASDTVGSGAVTVSLWDRDVVTSDKCLGEATVYPLSLNTAQPSKSPPWYDRVFAALELSLQPRC